MEVITKQQVVDAAPGRWERSYRHSEYKPHQEITSKLRGLQAPLDASEVDAIIGNTTWTELKCDECRQDVELVVQLGQEPDYESATASVCVECLEKAVKMAEGVVCT